MLEKETKIIEKYREFYEIFRKQPTIHLTMEADTPGYFSDAQQQKCMGRTYKRCNNRKK